jgi:hypothetical protein
MYTTLVAPMNMYSSHTQLAYTTIYTHTLSSLPPFALDHIYPFTCYFMTVFNHCAPFVTQNLCEKMYVTKNACRYGKIEGGWVL